MTRNFPLFIIDDSRSHGRGRETDFVSCTSKEFPWIGEITLLNEQELAIDQDWSSKSTMCLYSEPRGVGIRTKLKVVSTPVVVCDKNRAELQSLMRRCMKEYLLRHSVVDVSTDDVSDEAVVKLADVLLRQAYENLRTNPDDRQTRLAAGVLAKIKKDYQKMVQYGKN